MTAATAMTTMATTSYQRARTVVIRPRLAACSHLCDFAQSTARRLRRREEALDSLPPDLREFMSNVAIVVEEEPPPGVPLLGLYQGFPLTTRGRAYTGVPPDKITIYRRPLERLYAADPARLRREIRRVVLHEVAHHFGISDERLVEIGRY
jgi:predicted Zn-dependent protease with MMP-like domain